MASLIVALGCKLRLAWQPHGSALYQQPALPALLDAARGYGVLGEHRICQRRYWEHLLRAQGDLTRQVDYIHINRVKHGLVSRALDWLYSSIHRYMRMELVTADWAGEAESGV